jgi:hypothetical protein
MGRAPSCAVLCVESITCELWEALVITIKMIEEIVSILGRHWPIAISVLFVAWLAKNHLNHGLNKYPGPFLAGLTDWWRFLDVYGLRPDITHLKLHRQHGDIVRLGPNVLSFSDPKAIKQIYGLNKGFVKVSKMTEVPRTI